jgi:hypothetical protein
MAIKRSGGWEARMEGEHKKKRRRRWFRRPSGPPVPKLNMDAVPDYGAVATRLMAKMGFEAGMGLGPSGGGIREPIAVDAGQRKAGLGYAKPKRRRRRKGKRSRWGALIKGIRSLLLQRAAKEVCDDRSSDNP